MTPGTQSKQTAPEPNHHSSHPISIDLRGLAEEAELLAEAIVDTVRESLLILDDKLSIRLANRSFYVTFGVAPEDTLDRSVYEVGNGEWDIPRLRELLQGVLPKNESFRDFEVVHEFPRIGRKVMLLNARKLRRIRDQTDLILLAIEDVTQLWDREQRLVAGLREKQTLVQEIHHRVKNNLQMIVSLLTLHAGQASDPQVIKELSEAGGRVQAIARLHEMLYASDNLAEIHFGEFLQHLTNELQSLHSRAGIIVQIFSGDIVLGLDTAVPLGLIANELILNCFKHAFPSDRAGEVIVTAEYVSDSVGPGESLGDAAIRLRVQDNGVGPPPGFELKHPRSLGLSLVQWLAQQLHAQVQAETATGLSVTVTIPCGTSTS